MPDYNDEYTYENIPQRRKNPMSTAALALGILSITCCSVFYVALPFGAIAIICAILSRGKGQMPGKSRAGIICGSVGLIATVIITVSSVYFVLTTENGRNYLQYYRIYSGDYDFDLDETLEEMFPFLYGSDGGTDSSGQDGSGSSGSDGSDGGGQEYGGFENELPGGGSGDGGSSGSGGSDDGNSGSNNGSDNSSQPDDGGFI